MNILITGCTGALGTAILGFIRNQFENSQSINVKCFRRRLHDYSFDDLKTVLIGFHPEIIIHLASPKPASFENFTNNFVNSIENGSKILAEIAVYFGTAKFIFVSSAAVYGDQNLKFSLEEGPYNPTNKYGQFKLTTEQKLFETIKNTDTQLIILRLFNLWGPGFEESLVNKLLNTNANKPLHVISPEYFVRDYIHVFEVVDAIMKVIFSPVVLPSIINVSTGIGVSTSQLIELITRIQPVFVEKESSDKKISFSVGDSNLLKESLSFYPRDIFSYFEK